MLSFTNFRVITIFQIKFTGSQWPLLDRKQNSSNVKLTQLQLFSQWLDYAASRYWLISHAVTRHLPLHKYDNRFSNFNIYLLLSRTRLDTIYIIYNIYFRQERSWLSRMAITNTILLYNFISRLFLLSFSFSYELKYPLCAHPYSACKLHFAHYIL